VRAVVPLSRNGIIAFLILAFVAMGNASLTRLFCHRIRRIRHCPWRWLFRRTNISSIWHDIDGDRIRERQAGSLGARRDRHIWAAFKVPEDVQESLWEDRVVLNEVSGRPYATILYQ
jgi:hypothetical protein